MDKEARRKVFPEDQMNTTEKYEEEKSHRDDDDEELYEQELSEARLSLRNKFLQEKHEKAQKIIDEYAKNRPKTSQDASLFNYNQYFKKRYLE